MLFLIPRFLASKLPTSKCAKILRAIKFVPEGRQSGLVPTQTVGGSTVNPDEDLFLKLRQLRRKPKEERDRQPTGSAEHQRLDTVQNELKIIANAASYGIFIEINTEDSKCEVDPDKQIKPYNFVLVGSPTMLSKNGEPIIPLTQFTSQYGQAPYQPFIDANSGKPYEESTELYWKKLDRTVEDYVEHPESKFENGAGCGAMRRRSLRVDSVSFIGKESNELEEAELLGLDNRVYVEYHSPSGNA